MQENCIDLVGRIADRGAEMVSAREWMRICFELLEMLKAPKKAIRRSVASLAKPVSHSFSKNSMSEQSMGKPHPQLCELSLACRTYIGRTKLVSLSSRIL